MGKLSMDEVGGVVLSPTSEVACAVQLSVGGMTCSSCVRTITDTVSELEGVSEISVNQLGKSAYAVVARASLADSLVTLIDDLGYEAQVISITPVASSQASKGEDKRRTVALEFKDVRSM